MIWELQWTAPSGDEDRSQTTKHEHARLGHKHELCKALPGEAFQSVHRY